MREAHRGFLKHCVCTICGTNAFIQPPPTPRPPPRPKHKNTRRMCRKKSVKRIMRVHQNMQTLPGKCFQNSWFGRRTFSTPLVSCPGKEKEVPRRHITAFGWPGGCLSHYGCFPSVASTKQVFIQQINCSHTSKFSSSTSVVKVPAVKSMQMLTFHRPVGCTRALPVNSSRREGRKTQATQFALFRKSTRSRCPRVGLLLPT